jgi:hypothetical protein
LFETLNPKIISMSGILLQGFERNAKETGTAKLFSKYDTLIRTIETGTSWFY